jgi:hypothetical protein
MAQETLNDALDNSDLTFLSGGESEWLYFSDATAENANSAKSGAVGKDQASWITTTISGPGYLEFKWKVSSKTDEDFLEFYINGVRLDRISGAVDWANKAYTSELNEYKDYEVKWQYRRYSDVPDADNAGWLDHVVFTPITCLPPSNLHLKSLGDASVTVAWHESHTATKWNVEYGLVGFIKGEGQISIVDDIPEIELSGLTKGEVYSVYVQAACGADDGDSEWVGPYSFMVDCDAISTPFFESFDVEDASNLPNCWRSSFTQGSAVVRNTDFAKSARYSVRMVQLRDSYAMLILPLAGVEVSSLLLSFDALLDDFYEDDAHLQVGVIDNPYDLSTFSKVKDVTFPLADANKWLSTTVSFDKYNGVGRYIAFKLVSSDPLNRARLHIDNVNVDILPLVFVSPTSETQITKGDNIDIEINVLMQSDVKLSIVDSDNNMTLISELEDKLGSVLDTYSSSSLTAGGSYRILAEHIVSGYSIYSEEFVLGVFSFNKQQNSNGLNAFPIPVKSILYLSHNYTDNKLAVLYDVHGREVLNFYLNQLPLNVSNIASGIYFVKIDDATVKIIKE